MYSFYGQKKLESAFETVLGLGDLGPMNWRCEVNAQ